MENVPGDQISAISVEKWQLYSLSKTMSCPENDVYDCTWFCQNILTHEQIFGQTCVQITEGTTLLSEGSSIDVLFAFSWAPRICWRQAMVCHRSLYPKNSCLIGSFGLEVTWGRVEAKMMATIKQRLLHSQFEEKSYSEVPNKRTGSFILFLKLVLRISLIRDGFYLILKISSVDLLFPAVFINYHKCP